VWDKCYFLYLGSLALFLMLSDWEYLEFWLFVAGFFCLAQLKGVGYRSYCVGSGYELDIY